MAHSDVFRMVLFASSHLIKTPPNLKEAFFFFSILLMRKMKLYDIVNELASDGVKTHTGLSGSDILVVSTTGLFLFFFCISL